MFIKRDQNEYGAPTIVINCDFCGETFSVCFGKEITDEEIQCVDKVGCQHESCKSYNPATDMDKVFATKEEIAKEKVIDIRVLQNRKNLQIFSEKVE